MPVRIYDISKKLGLENKEILAKAKALGIAAAKVPSSSLDKISAEWLEEELLKDHPEARRQTRAASPSPEPPKPAPVEEKIVLITAPPPEPKPEVKAEPVKPSTANRSPPVVETPPPPPPKPAGPKVGDKVGFIQLPPRARSRAGGERSAGPAKLPPSRPGAPQRGRFAVATSISTLRSGRPPKPRRQPREPAETRPRQPQPKFVAPDDRRSHRHQAADCRARTGRRS